MVAVCDGVRLCRCGQAAAVTVTVRIGNGCAADGQAVRADALCVTVVALTRLCNACGRRGRASGSNDVDAYRQADALWTMTVCADALTDDGRVCGCASGLSDSDCRTRKGKQWQLQCVCAVTVCSCVDAEGQAVAALSMPALTEGQAVMSMATRMDSQCIDGQRCGQPGQAQGTASTRTLPEGQAGANASMRMRNCTMTDSAVRARGRDGQGKRKATASTRKGKPTIAVAAQGQAVALRSTAAALASL